MCRLQCLEAIFLILSVGAVGYAQGDLSTPAQAVSLTPQTVAKSNLFHLHAGESIGVTGETSDPNFAVDLYVYDSGRRLVGKDDEDSVSPTFEWQAVADGDYYVLARNLSTGSGSIRISVIPTKSLSIFAPPAYAQVRIFYATDRNITGQSAPNIFYGTQPDSQDRLHFGQAIISIPREHRMGELEGPSILRLELREDPAKHVVLQQVSEEKQGDFLSDIATRVKHSEGKEALVFVHGFNTTFSDAARRTAQIAYDLGFDGPAILYSWPSQGSISPIAYNMDSRNSELTTDHLRTFLDLLVAHSGATTIHLIAHSMGNRPLTAALTREAPAGKDHAPTAFNQLVLMAPDIDAALFRGLAERLRPSAHRITLYASSQDGALKLSQIYAGYARAGEGGQQILILPGIDSVDASTVDTSMIGLYHQYYADNSTVLSDLFHVLRGDAASTRFGLQSVVTGAGVYWKFRAAAR